MPDYYNIKGLDGELSHQDVSHQDVQGKPRHTTLFLAHERQSYEVGCYSEAEACLQRMYAFANGAMFEIEHAKHLTQAEKDRRFLRIQHTVTRYEKLIAKKKNRSKNKVSNAYPDLLRTFYYDALPAASGLSTETISLGEAMWAWQVFDRPATRTTIEEVNAGGKRRLVVQQEETLNSRLTERQKQELLGIHADIKDAPKWFQRLHKKSPGAAAYLQTIVPQSDPGNWQECERCRPAILRHIPGQANALRHRHVILDISELSPGTDLTQFTWSDVDKLMKATPDNVLSDTTAFRQGAPSAFNMKDDSERQQSATDNLEQLLPDNDTLTQLANDFNTRWGLKGNTVKVPILLGGLLTPSEQSGVTGKLLDGTNLSGSQNNTRLTKEKRKAAEALSESVPDTVAVYELNVAVNKQRAHSLPPIDAKFLANLALLCGQANPTNSQAKNDLAILKEIDGLLSKCAELEIIPGRNLHLYVAALYDVATRLMGGVSTGNCKSSKDRKSAELIMADAMIEYRCRYGKLPGYTDRDGHRKQFSDIYVRLYCSRHHQALAHDNSPGSAGIKDEGILDKDIKKDLGDSYRASKTAANFNKPGSLYDKHVKRKLPASSLMSLLMRPNGLGKLQLLIINIYVIFAVYAALKSSCKNQVVGTTLAVFQALGIKPSQKNANHNEANSQAAPKADTSADERSPTPPQPVPQPSNIASGASPSPGVSSSY